MGSGKGQRKKILGIFFAFTKIEHTLFSLPLLFAGAWLAPKGSPSAVILLLIVLAALGARIFGMAMNRIFDWKIDAKNPRTANREIPQGILSIRTAYGIAASGAVVYFVVCFILGGWCLKLAVIPLIPLLFYSLLKRYTWLCHFGLGLCLAIAPLGAYVAASETVMPTKPLMMFAMFTFFWVSGSDIICALLDMEFDRDHGIHSIPARWGAKGAEAIASTCNFLSFCCACIMIYFLDFNLMSGLLLAILGVLLIILGIPNISPGFRFFPLSVFAGMAGVFIVLLGV